jgi:hypothetical protein
MLGVPCKGYEYKFKDKQNDFQLQCAEIALKYDDHNLNAMLLKAEVLEQRLVAQKKDISKLQKQKDFLEYQQWVTRIFSLGYREMPYEMKNILIKGWTKDTIIQLSLIDHTPKRLKNSNVQQTRYASLSWGLFDEEIETKRLERYSNTVFDTKHKTIVAFLPNDILYNQYTFDPVVFALNIDPLAHKFPWQSPYSSFGDNPIYNVDVGGAYQYPAKLAAGYTKDYPMITKYLAENVQYDIKKSPIVQDAVTRNANGGYSKQDLIWKVAAWNNKESPTITYEEGLTKRTNGNARAQTLDQHNIHIDADYARSVDKILGSDKSSPEEKQSAILQFYQTVLDETTHTGDFKKNKGYSSGGEVGGAAVNEIYYNKRVKTDDGQVIDVFNPASDKEIYQNKTSEGKSEVLPTVPQKGK